MIMFWRRRFYPPPISMTKCLIFNALYIKHNVFVLFSYRQWVSSVCFLISPQKTFKITLGIRDCAVLQSAHDEVQHWVCFPLLLQFHHLQSPSTLLRTGLEQILLPFEIGFECIAEQRLAESAGSSKEYIIVFVGKIVHHVCLVNIQLSLFPYLLELVGINRVSESAHFYPSQMRHRPTVSLNLSAKVQNSFQFPVIFTVFGKDFNKIWQNNARLCLYHTTCIERNCYSYRFRVEIL